MGEPVSTLHFKIVYLHTPMRSKYGGVVYCVYVSIVAKDCDPEIVAQWFRSDQQKITVYR